MTDRRFLRTERQLVAAMLHLAREKPYHAITVDDIAAQADIARKTFYAHFANKQQLLWHSLQTEFEAIIAESSDLNPQSLLMDGKPLSYPVFQHIYDYAVLYRDILNDNADAVFMLQLWDYITAQSFMKHAALRAIAPFLTVPPELIAHVMSGALLGAVRWWLQSDMQTSPEQMAYRFSQLLAPGVLQSMGLDGD